MRWNGRRYRPGYGINVYPPKEDSMAELLKPLGEKTKKGNVWIPVLNQPINVYKEAVSPPPVETYYIITQSSDELITQSGDNLIWLI